MPRRSLLIFPLALACFVAPAMNAAQAPNADAEREYSATVQPFLNAYCASCHTGEKAAAQLDLRQYSSPASVVQDFAKWDRVREKLAAHQMPPKQAKQPAEGARQRRHQLDRRDLEEPRRAGMTATPGRCSRGGSATPNTTTPSTT